MSIGAPAPSSELKELFASMDELQLSRDTSPEEIEAGDSGEPGMLVLACVSKLAREGRVGGEEFGLICEMPVGWADMSKSPKAGRTGESEVI